MAARKKSPEQNLETGEPEPNELLDEARTSGIVAGSLWMLGITMALFFLPVVNGIIGGIVGGYKVGTTKSAVLAAIFPAIIAGFLLWIVLTITSLPIMGVAAGAVLALLIILSDLGMLVGAAIGGTIAQNKIDWLNRA